VKGRAKGSGRHLHLDAFSGMAGNMLMGALLDLGLSRKALVEDLAGLGLDFKLKVSRVQRGALSGRYVSVVVPKSAHGRAAKSKQEKGSKKSAGHHAHGRHYRDIQKLLARAKLDEGVRARAQAIFLALASAEARVHGCAVEDVHFHEVGAVDAIVDVTAAAIGLERLGVSHMSCGPVALGHGSVDTDHGRLPLPAPATLELLRGIPTVPAHVEWETVTPTGAAILKTQVDEFSPLPAMTVEAVGYGAGNDRHGPMPNLVRAVLGASDSPLESDRIVCLEANLDDFVPEHFDFLMERLFEDGALDVSLAHIQMKKNRAGFLVRVLAQPRDRRALAQTLFAESSTIGVRTQEWDRLLLRREEKRIKTPFGPIRVKFIHAPDGAVRPSAEYDDCKRAARRAGVPLREVVRSAETLARGSLA